MTQLTLAGHRVPVGAVIAWLAPLACLTWAYWTNLGDAAQRWAYDPQYSHGFLVPIFAGVLLWLRRGMAPALPLRGAWWGGLILAAGLGLRLYGTWYYRIWLDGISLLPCLTGLFVLVGGVQALRWAWPAIAFLFFMIPVPFSVSIMLAGPLQQFATTVSTFALQTLGVPAIAEGNTILLSQVTVGIVEACSGLSMLVIFFAQSSAVALLIKKPLWQKGIVILSAIPIALITNVIRITATGVLHETVGSQITDDIFHPLAGYLMPALALGMLWLELAFMKRLWRDDERDGWHPESQQALRTMSRLGSLLRF